MRGTKVKALHEIGGKFYRKRVAQKNETLEKLRNHLPKNVGHSSKKRHKNESILDFKGRRKKVNKAKRERRKMRHAHHRNSKKSARA